MRSRLKRAGGLRGVRRNLLVGILRRGLVVEVRLGVVRTIGLGVVRAIGPGVVRTIGPIASVARSLLGLGRRRRRFLLAPSAERGDPFALALRLGLRLGRLDAGEGGAVRSLGLGAETPALVRLQTRLRGRLLPTQSIDELAAGVFLLRAGGAAVAVVVEGAVRGGDALKLLAHPHLTLKELAALYLELLDPRQVRRGLLGRELALRERILLHRPRAQIRDVLVQPLEAFLRLAHLVRERRIVQVLNHAGRVVHARPAGQPGTAAHAAVGRRGEVRSADIRARRLRLRLRVSVLRGRRLGRGRARRLGRHRFSARATRRREARALLLPPRRQAPAFLHLLGISNVR